MQLPLSNTIVPLRSPPPSGLRPRLQTFSSVLQRATNRVSFSSRFRRGTGAVTIRASSWEQQKREEEIRARIARLEEERQFAQKVAVEALAEIKKATAAVEASRSMAQAAVAANDEQAARYLLMTKAHRKEELEQVIQKAETKQAVERKLGQLIQALEMELIGIRSAANPIPGPPPPPPKPKYVSDQELSDKFLELERGDLEAQLRRELKARGEWPPSSY